MYTNEIYDWLLTALFWFAALLLVFGLALMIVPQRVMKSGNFLNTWVSTNGFFSFVNAPRYQERFIYRHHRIFGSVITVITVSTLYMLAFYTSRANVLAGINAFAQGAFYQWLFVILYNILLILNALALLTGIVVFIRPSLLKRLEQWGNRWVNTNNKLEQFDKVYDIPEDVLPGKPRWFGLFVCLGAAYIMYNLGNLIF